MVTVVGLGPIADSIPTVLFLDEDGSIKLYTKGADSFIFKIAKPGQLEE